MSVDCEARTVDTISQCLQQLPTSKLKFGCVCPPLLNVAISNIVVDELHLMLRVTDVLIRNLIWAMLHLDTKEQHQGKEAQFVDRLLSKIRSCGITFRVGLVKYCQLHYLTGFLLSKRYGKTRMLAKQMTPTTGHH